MKLMNVRHCVLMLVIGIIIWLPQPSEAIQTSEGVRITIVHTNDTHTRIKPEDNSGKSMGWATLAAAIKKERELNPDTLVLDAGDTFHGLPLATLSNGEIMVPLLNLTGYDAMCLGNQDFNYGVPHLLELSKRLNFPILVANVAYKDSGQLPFAPYKEFNLSGVKIAVFGLVTPETKLKISPLLTKNLSFLDPVQQAQLMVDKLRSNNDLVIAVTHLGIDLTSADKSTIVAQKVKGIDIIIDGHSHTVLPQGIHEGDTLICQTGCYASCLGEVNVTIKNHRVVDKSAKLLGLEEVNRLAPIPDQEVLREIERSTKSAQPMLEKVIGQSSRKFQYNREQIRTGETELGDYAADAYRGICGADIAIVNAGTFRADIPQGTITRGDTIKVFPFGNVVQKIQVTGAQVKEALEHGVSRYPADVGIFPQVSGISFTLDSSAQAGKRVVSVEVNGKPLDLTQKYSLAVTNFMHIGGDGYSMLVNAPLLGEYGLADDVLAAWISRGENLRSFGQRIRIDK
ncbi:bifunctional UDP-sugar hydrolase/5'-nucleotidase [Selenomonas ruminantium]|uniref:bifunctional metallophosphatase/5'-nucleotidase n=1 Tax=Selenomonas ruminantium TaxID=971 RepID=UPI0026EDDCE8|nr:bifunctional UDP-sugar hydrolase/5'-nucleotidase [Selenomonas ruminantium]